MKSWSLIIAVIFLLSVTSLSQEKSNDEISRQIRSLGVDHMNVTFDTSSNTSKLMAVAENFANRDADNAGVQAINFAMGFFYTGMSLKTSPQSVHFSFWVLTKKPRFAQNHHLTADVDGRVLDLGDARYAAKSMQNLEYLNFELSNTDLATIGSAGKVIFHLGDHAFTATMSQIKLIGAMARISGASPGA